MERGRPKAKLVVSPSERATLERWASRPKTAQAPACRARIVLFSAQGLTNRVVAHKLGVTHQMVGKWRTRFVQNRLDGLLDEPRPGRPRKVADAEIERVIVRTLESIPRDATHWSVRSMAKATGMTPTTIHRIWRAFSLQPHRTETFKLSKDPLFIEKVRDIVGLYLNPPASECHEAGRLSARSISPSAVEALLNRLRTGPRRYRGEVESRLSNRLRDSEAVITMDCGRRLKYKFGERFARP
jgi:transposase